MSVVSRFCDNRVTCEDLRGVVGYNGGKQTAFRHWFFRWQGCRLEADGREAERSSSFRLFKMMKKRISIVLLLSAAAGAGYIIYEDQTASQQNDEALEQYLEQDGIEREQLDEEDMISHGELEGTGTEPGQQAPPFELAQLGAEETLALEELEGSFVVVNMWATWCPPCRDEMPDFVEFYETYQDDNVEMVGVNMTSTESGLEPVQQFVDDFQIPFYTVLDEEGIMEDRYNVYAMPSTYIIDPEGRVAMSRPGYLDYEILVSSYEDIRANYEAEE
ncbi:hypothetical protein ALCH109712_00035 [Alkalicoccus chagannorensis]